MKLTDLKDLRIIKKSLEPQSEPKPQQNQPRKRSVELKSKEEEHALRKELPEVFALSCTYTYSTPGITNVTIR